MREALIGLLARFGAAAARRAAAELWHTFDEIDTAQCMPLGRVLRALEGLSSAAVAGVHAPAFARSAPPGKFASVLVPAGSDSERVSGARLVAPRSLDAALDPVEALVLTDAAWTALLISDSPLLKSVALKVKRRLIAPLRARPEAVWANWSAAFHCAERDAEHCWRWTGREPGAASLGLTLEHSDPLDGTLNFVVWSLTGGSIEAEIGAGAQRLHLKTGEPVALPLQLVPGENTLKFSSAEGLRRASGDSRLLGFAIVDLSWRSGDRRVSLEPLAAYALESAAAAGEPVRLGVAEQHLHAAGFWTVEAWTGPASETPDGRLLRRSTGVHVPRLETGSGPRGRTADRLLWLIAERW